ncbi:jerky protein homolog-like [Bactrocera dorsalis]|uniref:Jerky protein homolog-like n=1 Tax=Bactrocera dorsalis TaxID=27457 RepID=A0A8N4KXC8_BACDO|nr:jerky protein homolog-like [Bactrocera dorsalis]
MSKKQNIKQTRLNFVQKTEIIAKIDKGVSGKQLAFDYGVCEATITKIKKKRFEILEAVSNSYGDLNRKTLHKPEFIELEQKIYDWFLMQRQRNCNVNGAMLKSIAKTEFARLYPQKQFSASDGWLTNFKKRYGIRNLKICGEILSSDTAEITPFIHKLRTTMDEMGITEAQLYNADESGLFYRMLPDRTFVAATEKTAPGRKILKERITFMLCANADGSHKLKPMVIGKSANPRCFSGFNNPLEYVNSKKAWMNSQLFSEWFHNSFTKQVRTFCSGNNLPHKALLLVDNCSAHKPIERLKSDDGNIVTMLLPPNVTAVIQPMDQNPIRLVKLGYRSKLLCNIMAQKHLTIALTLKQHSIRDAIMLLKSAWDELPQTVLINAWNKIRKWGDNEYDEEDNIPLAQLIETSVNDEYAQLLQEVSLLLERVGNNTVIDSEDIENWNDDKETADEIEILSDTSDGEEVSQEPKVTYAEAIQSVNNLIHWFKHENDANQVSDLLNCRTKMVRKYIAKEKNKRIFKIFSLHSKYICMYVNVNMFFM